MNTEEIFAALGGINFCMETRADYPQAINNNSGVRFALRLNKQGAKSVEITDEDEGLAIRFYKVQKPKLDHKTNTVRPFKKILVHEITGLKVNELRDTLYRAGGWQQDI